MPSSPTPACSAGFPRGHGLRRAPIRTATGSVRSASRAGPVSSCSCCCTSSPGGRRHRSSRMGEAHWGTDLGAGPRHDDQVSPDRLHVGRLLPGPAVFRPVLPPDRDHRGSARTGSAGGRKLPNRRCKLGKQRLGLEAAIVEVPARRRPTKSHLPQPRVAGGRFASSRSHR